MNHQRKLSAAIIENFQGLEQLNWQYSRQTRAQVFPWQEINSPWAHVVQDRVVYDAGASMNRPWIVGKRNNPIYDGDSNRSTLQSVYRYERNKWKEIGEDFYPVERTTRASSMFGKDEMLDGGVGFENGRLQYGERGRFPTNLTRINERPSIISMNDIKEFRWDRTDSELTDPTEDPLLRVKMNKKRPSLVVKEVERQKKSRTGDFYAKNQTKLENYEKNIREAGATEALAFQY